MRQLTSYARRQDDLRRARVLYNPRILPPRAVLTLAVTLGLGFTAALSLMPHAYALSAPEPKTSFVNELAPLPDENNRGWDVPSPTALFATESDMKLTSNSSGNGTPVFVLTGRIQTLQDATESEKETVDWYGWYLSVREYLRKTGSFQCQVGTPIKFYKSGYIEALTTEPLCRASAASHFYALPEATALDAIILPIRNSNKPTTKDDLFTHIPVIPDKPKP